MYFHGSQTRREVGEILIPGAHLGVNSACEHVYMTTDEGVSVTEAERFESYGVGTAREYAVKDASVWGADFNTERTFLHIVRPLGKVEIDPHWDVSPVCMRAASAEVLAVFEGPIGSMELFDRVQEWVGENTYVAA